jgi:hypothetical protein
MWISSSPSRRSWALRTTILGATLAAAGIVLLVYGWWRISGEARVAAQLPYLVSSSIPGAALVIAGAILWTRSRPQPSDPRVDALLGLLTEPIHAAESASNGSETPATDADSRLVVVRGATHYHRPGCLLVAGKDTSPYDGGLATPGNLEACPLCIQSP